MQRRQFLTLFAGAAFPSEQRRYPDPATELEVFRLTDPAHSAYLPRHGASKRNNFLLYASDRTGTWQAFRLDLKSGESRQLTEAEPISPATLTLLPDDRGFLYCAADTLHLALLNGHTREIGSAASLTSALSVSDDAQYCSFSANGRIQLAALTAKPTLITLIESPGTTVTQIRPKRTQVLYLRADGGPHLINFNGQSNRPLKLDPIPNANAATVDWITSGRTFLYLRSTDLREHTPDDNSDKLVARTSQFASFGINSDSSVFVGPSASKASAYLLLLLRVTRREFTLCEHRASDPALVRPVFTPGNQSVLFQSDRHGKPAIYRMRVDKLVESAESDTDGLMGK
jgi:oligogalacturonide lyase